MKALFRIRELSTLLILLARIFTGPLCVLIHYAWMRAAAQTLDAEGALKP